VTTSLRLSCDAMATRFEVVLRGGDAARLRAAGEEALEEIQRLDRQLSFYRPESDISWLNTHAASEPAPVEPRLFQLLERCMWIAAATEGAFDITVAPLMRAWSFVAAGGALPEPEMLARARAAVGFHLIQLDCEHCTVHFTHPGVAIDLGAAGKGYAIDRAMDVLAEHRIGNALLHGGTSSVHAFGHDEEERDWKVAWSRPDTLLEEIPLHDAALSVSAVHGKSFAAEGRTFGHVIDPRSGEPTAAARSALVVGPRSFECDALSTAALVLGPTGVSTLIARFPDYHARVAA
jgi:thiamine biosynthesis lipoprotein